MKKCLLLLSTVLFFIGNVQAQTCVPDPLITAPGVYPDTSDNLPPAYKDIYYESHIQVNTITDTVLPQGNLHVDYGQINSITGLPPGISYNCNPSNCQVNGGAQGCLLFYGTCKIPGTYKLVINVTIKGKMFGWLPISYNYKIPGYIINVNAAPIPAFTSNVKSVCNGGVIKYYDASLYGPTTWSWSFPGGTPSLSSVKKPIIKYYQAGDYDVILTTTNLAGTNTQVFPNYVHVDGNLPEIKLIGNDSICAGGSVLLKTTNVSQPVTYQWIRNNVALSGATSVNYTAGTFGTYVVKVTNSSGCTSTSAGKIIKVMSPVATITALGPTTFCAGNSVTLAATQVATQTYQWNYKSLPIPGAIATNYVATSAGKYTVLVTDKIGCTKTSPAITVTINCREEGMLNNQSSMELFPVPVSDILNVNYYSDDEAAIEAHIFDITGRFIQTVSVNKINTGENHFSTDVSNLEQGIYLFEIIKNGKKEIARFNISR